MKKTLISTFILLSGFCVSQAQTIPNAGFENWTNAGSYSTPDGWGNLNSLTSAQRPVPKAHPETLVRLT